MGERDVPIIDISPYHTGSVSQRQSLAAEVANAVERIGFFAVVGHGIDTDTLVDAATQLRRFFDLPLDMKARYVNPSRNINRGYVPYGEEFTAATEGIKAPPDLREAIAFGRFDLPDEPYYRAPEASYAYERNFWPTEIDGFADSIKRMYRSAEQLNQRLLQIFATALELAEDYFLDKFDKHASVLRAINYPEQATAAQPGQLRCGPHTDFGSHTLLHVLDAPGGLQVLDRHRAWVDVKPPENSFVVNIGDLMMTWTNDRWLSNLHRVVNPPRHRYGSSRRQSIAFFVQPNYDARIECIPTCKSADEPAKHAATTAWQYRHAKLSRMTIHENEP